MSGVDLFIDEGVYISSELVASIFIFTMKFSIFRKFL